MARIRRSSTTVTVLAVLLLSSLAATEVVHSSLLVQDSTTVVSQNNPSCTVVSPLDGSCGFVVNPPSWAVSFPQLDHPTSYFDNGTYGIVWINSTTFNVIEPEAGYPAACIVTLPSGTVVTSQNSTFATANLPDGYGTVEVPIPQYSFCPTQPPFS